MSQILNKFREARAAHAAAQQALEELQANPELKKYQDFETKLRALMGQFSMSLVDVNQLLDVNYKPPKNKPQPVVQQAPKKTATKGSGKASAKAGGKTKRPRRLRTFTNPHTGERVVHAGGVHKTLQEWKEKWGADAVKTWGVLGQEETPPEAAQA